MMNNQNIINKKYTQQISYQPQRSHYRSSERNNNYSPNVYANNNNININSLKNPTQNYNMKTKKVIKNNNIYYINPRNNFNQMNSSQNMAVLKQIKSKQHNQIYVEGDLNNFMDNQMDNHMEIYPYSNLNKFNNNNMNFNNLEKQSNKNINRITNIDKTKNNRGMPRKSPIPIQKGYNNAKYLNNDNLSKYSTNSNNASYYTANSQLINNNYSISNLSQISGYSHNSYNNPMHYGVFFDNGHIRSYSNNTHSSMSQKKLSGNNSKKNILTNSKSVNDMINNGQYSISTYDNKVKTNNFINKINNNNFINVPSSKKAKYISKSPNVQNEYLSNTIKRKSNLNQDNGFNYNNMFNNNNIDIANVNNIINDNLFNKMAYRTSNFGSTYNNNLNLYENYNNNNNFSNNNKNKINYNSRPLSSHSHITKRRRSNNINMISNNLGINPNNININNYNSNDRSQKQKLIYNNINKYNNYIKRDYSANIRDNNRININKINSDNTNNLNSNINPMNQNPMVNLHIINKGQIINNNYNNINNNMGNMNNYYVYKYNVCQNNPGKNNNMVKTKNNSMLNNINNMNNLNNMNIVNNGVEIDINYKDNERKNNHKHTKKNGKIRSNSSSGVGVTGELNNIIIQRENDRNNQIKMVQKKINSKNKNMNNNSKSKNMKNNINNSKKSQNRNVIEKPIRNIHHFTHVGFNGEKDKDFNQDIAFLEKNFAGNNSYLYLGVCDGHGVEGHEVSGFIKSILPKDLSNSLFRKEILTNDINLKKKIYNIIGETFIKVNEKLISNESINSIFSGTTCVSVIYTPIRLICANIGDSRAVLGRFDKNLKKWISINLSRDHKPTEEDEARRIYKKGGRIKPFIDEETGEEVGPQRVWVKDDEVPGLAMTRSFGDRVASIAGTICVPEIKEYNFNEGDKFLIEASDGVWEFIQSEECINIIGKFYFNNNIEGCCEFLYEESRKRWLKEEEVVDDITMLLVFFD